MLAYRTSITVPRRLVWFDRSGSERGTVVPIDEHALASPEISHDGRRAAVVRTVATNTDVWLIDLARGIQSRLTFFGPHGFDAAPGHLIVARSSGLAGS